MEDPKDLVRGQKILFLTTEDMSPPDLKGQNADILPEFARLGSHVTFRNCIGPSEPLDTESLSQFNAIILWTCDRYNFHFEEFSRFLLEVLIPFQEEHPEVHVINGADIILWNAEKSYLSELEAAGFRISRTLFVDRSTHSPISFKNLLCSLDSKPVVLKPSVSASGRLTHCVKEPKSLSSDDEAFLEDILAEKSYIGSIMIQDYEEAISKGEYSLAFIGRELTLAVIKKPATGQFKVNQCHGGQVSFVEKSKIPACAKETGYRLWDYLDKKFGAQGMRRSLVYLRVDGVVRDDGEFVVGEAELIEPEMFMGRDGAAGFKAFCSASFVSAE